MKKVTSEEIPRFADGLRISKKGEMTIGTIIAIVIGVVILTILIYMLVYQKAIFKGRVEAFNSEENIDSLVLACNSLVDSEGVFSYCCVNNTANFGSGEKEITCDEFSRDSLSSGRVKFIDCSSISCF